MSSSFGQWLEAALLVMLIIQIARVLWALVTPVGLFGDWRASQPVVVGADARRALFAGFDPFFRAGGVQPGEAVQQVTSLPLKLFGISLNEASGLGSAIIADEAGVQTSYAVGDEIAPGIKLKEVHFDHVVIERAGVSENLFIDQSGSDPVAAPVGGAAAATTTSPAPGAPTPGAALGSLSFDKVVAAIGMVPRSEKGRVTGIVVSAQSSPEAFAAAGFRPGDIVVQVNGQPVSSAADIQSLQTSIRPGARISLMVERGAATVPVSLFIPDSK